MPIQGSEFTLRRELSTANGKDAYFLDGRSISKTDLHNIFKMSDIAQFGDAAKLVQMGRVNEIAHMESEQMLDLLMHYSGAKAHEE